MYKKTFLIQLFFILLILMVVSCQSRSDVVVPDRITTGEMVYETGRTQGDSSQTFGIINEHINQADSEIEFVYVQELQNRTISDSITVDSQTLVPIRYRSFVKEIQDIRIDYSIPGNTIIHIKRDLPNQKVDTTLEVKTEDRIYDYHWPTPLLYALNPPKTKGDSINVGVFTYRNRETMNTIRYAGLEQLMVGGKKYETHIWEETDSQSGMERTYWIDHQTNRLVQSNAILPNGVMFWIKRKDG